MKASEIIYARSIVRCIKAEIAENPDDVVILSPFLTSQTTETVVCDANPKTTQIYTVFSAENFINGASSLRTIKKLLEDGFSVFHLPKLHAKIVLTSSFASIGSQNLTFGGQTNHEASVVIKNRRRIRYLRDRIRKWLATSTPINLAMINDLEIRLPALRKAHLNLTENLISTDQVIMKLENERIDEENQNIALENQKKLQEEVLHTEYLYRKLRRRSRPLRAVLKTNEVTPSESIRARIETKDRYDDWMNWIDSYSTLSRTSPTSSFLDWYVPRAGARQNHVHLNKRNRYLLLLPETGRLSWPALNKTQISQYGTGLELSDPVSIHGQRYKFEYDFADRAEDLLTWNVSVQIRPFMFGNTVGNDHISVRGYFSLNSFRITKIEAKPDRENLSEATIFILNSLNSKEKYVNDVIIKYLFTPFQYQHNRNGTTAHDFFRGLGNVFDIRLIEYAGYNFLTAESVRLT